MEEQTPNEWVINEQGLMIIKINLEQPSGLALGLGALEMAKDAIRQWAMTKAIRDQQMKTRIIKPGIAN